MGYAKLSLITVLCFWATVTGSDILKVGPCDVGTKKVSFNCSQRGLKEVPAEIWDNVTMLDLSQNQLNLTNPKHLAELHRFQQVLLLNLSGNYLPFLEKDTLGTSASLQVLDLSTCQLMDIKPDALQGFPELRILLLGNNKLHDFMPVVRNPKLSLPDLHNKPCLRSGQDWLKGIQDVMVSRNETGELMESDLRRLRRKLLIEYNPQQEIHLNNTQETSPEAGHTPSWLYLLAALLTALAISLFVFLLVKCKLFQRYLDSYRHALLSEADTTSQCDPANLEVGFSDRSNRAPNFDNCNELDDDDGFIEDNYIQASERERAEREEEEKEEEKDLEDDIQFSFN